MFQSSKNNLIKIGIIENYEKNVESLTSTLIKQPLYVEFLYNSF